MAGRPKGTPKTGGRPPGGLNKSTASVKAALEEAFEKMGGIKALVEWGNDNPTEFYKLWSKLIPADIKLGGSVDGPLTINLVDYSKVIEKQ